MNRPLTKTDQATTIPQWPVECRNTPPAAPDQAQAGSETPARPSVGRSTGAGCAGRETWRRESSQLEVVAGKAWYNGRTLADWVDDVAARIFERSEAAKIVVFASVQRRDDGPDSDIDLLVVLPQVSRRHDDAVRVLRQLRDLPVPIDVTVIEEASLDDRSLEPGVVRVALREGRVVERAP